MPSDHDEEPSRKLSVGRYIKRAWLVLSVGWVGFALIGIVAEPNFTRLLFDRPLRVLGAVVGTMLAPPVIVYGMGLAAWFLARWIRLKIAARLARNR